MVLESEDLSQKAEKVSGPPKYDGRGNDGAEKITDAASARECTIPTAMAVPPSLKCVNWTFVDGRPWYTFVSSRAYSICKSRNCP